MATGSVFLSWTTGEVNDLIDLVERQKILYDAALVDYKDTVKLNLKITVQYYSLENNIKIEDKSIDFVCVYYVS